MKAWKSSEIAILLTSLLALCGCDYKYQRRVKAPALPAAAGNNAPAEQQSRFFKSPFALAVAEDAVVRLVGPSKTCSGTLIEDDLVLTAHHCVHGLEAGQIRIELGGDYLAWGEVKPRAIVKPPCGEKGGAGDIAILVLGRKLVGLPTMTPRLDKAPHMHEVVDPMGFGRCATSEGGIRRRFREGGPIQALTGETLLLEASVCPGDSGGPVVLRGSHEVLGVISMSAMDGDERTRARSIVARIDTYRSVFSHARLIADGLPANELPPLSCD